MKLNVPGYEKPRPAPAVKGFRSLEALCDDIGGRFSVEDDYKVCHVPVYSKSWGLGGAPVAVGTLTLKVSPKQYLHRTISVHYADDTTVVDFGRAEFPAGVSPDAFSCSVQPVSRTSRGSLVELSCRTAMDAREGAPVSLRFEVFEDESGKYVLEAGVDSTAFATERGKHVLILGAVMNV